jgi:UTP--glucose-1-phosphate uridylyltransferase
MASVTVKKAVIPAAGLGTRFLPATKSVPKEMLPIVDKPILLYVVEEAIRAGIEDIIIVAGRNKHGIEDFFDVSYELQDRLEKDGKQELLETILRVQSMVNVISIRQKQALGLGHAVLCARPIVGNEPFAVLLGDEIMIAGEHEKTVTQLLAESYSTHGKSTVAVMEVPPADVVKYGIVDAKPLGQGLFSVTSVVEKPAVDRAPSRLALPGRYVFDALLFDHLQNTRPGKNGEIQLTDAMTALARGPGLLATTFTSRRYDAGDKLGFLQANIELGLEHPEIGDGLRRYLRDFAKKL